MAEAIAMPAVENKTHTTRILDDDNEQVGPRKCSKISDKNDDDDDDGFQTQGSFLAETSDDLAKSCTFV